MLIFRLQIDVQVVLFEKKVEDGSVVGLDGNMKGSASKEKILCNSSFSDFPLHTDFKKINCYFTVVKKDKKKIIKLKTIVYYRQTQISMFLIIRILLL